MQCPYLVHKSTTTSAVRRARSSKLACCASSRETASAVVRSHVPRESRLVLGQAAAGTSHHSRAPKERDLSPVQCPCLTRGTTTASAARCARAASSSARTFPQETASTVARPRVPRESRPILGATAGTSHNSRTPKKRGLSPVQCPCLVHKPTTTSAARRARAASLRDAPPPERQ